MSLEENKAQQMLSQIRALLASDEKRSPIKIYVVVEDGRDIVSIHRTKAAADEAMSADTWHRWVEEHVLTD